MTALVALEGIVIALLVVLVAGLLISHAEILRKLDALGAGEKADARVRIFPPPRAARRVPRASLDGAAPSGGAVSVALQGSRGFTLLAFLSTGCSSCRPLWRGLAEGATRPGLRLVVVTKGPAEESASGVMDLVPGDTTAVMSTEAWESFGVPGTPYFLLLDTVDGRVLGEGSAGSWPRVYDLMAGALGHAGEVLKRSTPERLADADEALALAGISPGDPILYQKRGRV